MLGFPHLRRLVSEHDAKEGSLVEFLMVELRSFTERTGSRRTTSL